SGAQSSSTQKSNARRCPITRGEGLANRHQPRIEQVGAGEKYISAECGVCAAEAGKILARCYPGLNRVVVFDDGPIHQRQQQIILACGGSQNTVDSRKTILVNGTALSGGKG